MGCPRLTYKNDNFLKVAYSKKEQSASKNALDYFSGGMKMPNRNIVGDYRYTYQGQELDQETGKVAFQLRLYDQRINRWLTTDPAGQFYSPYLSMNNNWINGVDPDGGTWVDWYEVLDENGNGTGEVVWIDGNEEIDGFRHLGFNAGFTDVDGNRTFYDGYLQASFYNGEFREYHGGGLDEIIVTADIRSIGKKASDFTRDVLNPYVRTGSKIGNIVMSQTNVIIKEGPHPGDPDDWNNYTFPHYRQFDENWNYVKIPLFKSDELETMTDAISATPGGISLGIGKNRIQKKVINWVTNKAVKDGSKETLESLHQ